MSKSNISISKNYNIIEHVRGIVSINVVLIAILLIFSKSALAGCTYEVDNQWNSGFVASIHITNDSSTTVSSWEVSWQYSGDNRITSYWNANVTDSNPYSANGINGNGSIQPGQSITFGFQGTSSGVAETPNVTGRVCEGSNIDTDTSSDNVNNAPTDITPNVSGTDGYATRYWDCCKPHCGWTANVSEGIKPVASCNFNNESNGDDYLVTSSCDGGDGYTCFNMAPYAVNDKLAYGYAAVSASGDICGKCYQLDFKGSSYNAGDDPGSKALAGKTMIVKATNIGYDVSNGQIDLLVPGGGVGAFDACTKQWGASAEDMGEQYGGFLSACKQDVGWNAELDQYKSCVKQRCENIFSKSGMEDLLAGCLWYADWFEAADNPALVFKEVECPNAL
jgi:hypothetical protein